MKLHYKLSLSILTGLFIIVFIAQFYQYFTTNNLVTDFSEDMLQAFRDREEQAAKTLFHSLEQAVSSSLERGEMEKFTKLLEAQKDVEGLESFSLYNKEGVVTYSSDPSLVSQRSLPHNLRHLLTDPSQYFRREKAVIEIYQPQVVLPDCVRCHQTWEIGSVCGVTGIKFSSREALSDAEERAVKTVTKAKRTFLINAVVVVLGIVTVFMVTMTVAVDKYVRRPLGRVVEGVQAISKGERKRLKIASDIDRRDEIGILANAIITMNSKVREVLEETDRLIQAVQEGNLQVRGKTKAFEGGWRELVEGINNIIDAFMKPIDLTAQYIDQISKGDLPEEITGTYQGDFNDMKNNLNMLIASTHEVIALAQQIAGGNLDVKVEQRSEKDELMQALQKMVRYLQEVGAVTERIANKDLQVVVEPKSEHDALNHSLQHMVATLQTMMTEIERSIDEIRQQNWLRTGQAELGTKIRGEQDISTLARNIITYLATYLQANVGTLYLYDEGNDWLQLVGSYSYTSRRGNRNRLKLGEGVVGQAALEQQSIRFTELPKDYLSIASGLGQTSPQTILVTPVMYEGKVKGVIELGTLQEFAKQHEEFLDLVSENIAITFNSAQTRIKMQELLEATREQAKELQIQQEQLHAVNDELESQAANLRASEQKLQQQQEELRQTNEELGEQTKSLEQQQRELEDSNLELENARQLIEKKAEELELSSKYKSEFLANMSHELRTPLNSLLILSKLLAENKTGNLTTKQLEYITTIHSAGADLLELINEVLDLSKVEAGKMVVHTEEMSLRGLVEYVGQHFAHMAKEKGLKLVVKVTKDLPPSIHTDRQRVEQILKNLLSNALKFTAKGGITVHIKRPEPDVDLSQSGLLPAHAVAIAVIDTGVGIPQKKQRLIFEAFQQADGTTSRRFGGTGLGLSIVREFAILLGGQIKLRSQEGKGSVFTLYLPEQFEEKRPPAPDSAKFSPKQATNTLFGEPPAFTDEGLPGEASEEELIPVSGDRQEPAARPSKSMLVIEDDPKFAAVVADMARGKGFVCYTAHDGATGLQLAYQKKPDAIILDVNLPAMDGWKVMKNLKHNLETRHIPVHFISGRDDSLEAMKMGAIGYLTKPVTVEMLEHAFTTVESAMAHTIKRLLIVEDDDTMRKSMLELLDGDDVAITTTATGQEAQQLLKSEEFDCVVLDLGLTDISGFQLLETIKADSAISHLPIIVYTGKNLSRKEEARLKKHSESIILKGVKSEERLLDEVSLFLHRIETNLPKLQQQKLRMIHDKEEILEGKTILLADDDMRNVFALSMALEEKGMHVLIAENGKTALNLLEQHPDTDLTLMDIMMPEMDGYETMREIRKNPSFKKLPIIALTAKAMKGDRQRCIEAGANDYLSKPVDVDKLLSLLRVWLY